MTTLSPEQRRFLDTRRVAYLTTVDEGGAPHPVPVCFVLTESTAYVVSGGKPHRPGRRLDKRVRNLAGNPKASLAAEHYEEDWDRVAWVRVDGVAEIFTSGGEHDEAVRLLRERYPQFNNKDLDGAPVVALRIERVLSFGPLDVTS